MKRPIRVRMEFCFLSTRICPPLLGGFLVTKTLTCEDPWGSQARCRIQTHCIFWCFSKCYKSWDSTTGRGLAKSFSGATSQAGTILTSWQICFPSGRRRSKRDSLKIKRHASGRWQVAMCFCSRSLYLPLRPS